MRMELLQELPDLAEISANTVSDGDMTQDMITYYSTATSVCYSENVLLYWRDNSAKLPMLSQLAVLYLGTSASSVPVESLFSVTGLVVNSRRSSMQPCNLNKMVFLHDNFQLIVANNTPKTIEWDN